MVMIRIIFISLLSSLVLSCGFELQNTSNIGEKLDALTIKTNNPYSIFYRTLRNQFRESGTKIIDDVSQSDYTLTILMDESEQRTLSVSATNTPQEYEVYYRVTWSFSQGDKTILEAVTNLRTQDYTFDQRQLLGKSNESQMIKQALAKDIAQEVIFRLNEEKF